MHRVVTVDSILSHRLRLKGGRGSFAPSIIYCGCKNIFYSFCLSDIEIFMHISLILWIPSWTEIFLTRNIFSLSKWITSEVRIIFKKRRRENFILGQNSLSFDYLCNILHFFCINRALSYWSYPSVKLKFVWLNGE